MSGLTAAGTVREWQDAVNRRDEEGVLGLSDPEVEIVGPRGTGTGHPLLRAWLQHARVSLVPLRTYARGDRVVVLQRAVWRAPDGEEIGEAEVASSFVVGAGRVRRYARFDTLEAALADAGLAEADR